jgi:hypothetical protein
MHLKHIGTTRAMSKWYCFILLKKEVNLVILDIPTLEGGQNGQNLFL